MIKKGKDAYLKIDFFINSMKPYTWDFTLVLLLILMTTSIVVFYPYLFGKIIDVLFYNQDLNQFLSLVLVYLIIYGVNQVLHYLMNMRMAKLEIHYLFQIKRDIFNKILSLEVKTLTKLSTGDVMHRINQDVDEVLTLLYSDIFYGISALLDFTLCLILIATINTSLSIIIFLLVILTFVVAHLFKDKVKSLQSKIMELTMSNQAWLLELLQGLRDIKMIKATTYAIKKYMDKEVAIQKESFSVMKRETLADCSSNALQLCTYLVIITLSAFFISSTLLTLGGLIAILDYFNRMGVTLNRMYLRLFSIPKRLLAVERLMQMQSYRSESYDDKAEYSIKKGKIQLKDLCFSYDGKSKYVLNKLSLTIAAGEKIAIVGKSGGGKSTIAHLLLRMYAITDGTIEIDDHSIDQYGIGYLRSQIAYLHQNSVIFRHTLRYNIIFSNVMDYDAEIWLVLEQLALADRVRSLDQGLDTLMDEQHNFLSGGEKQRLFMARIYFKDVKIIIFDEATSALDEATEAILLSAWQKFFKDRTVIIIAHRLSTIAHVDRIALLEDGAIKACGDHERLLHCSQSYRDLFNKKKSNV